VNKHNWENILSDPISTTRDYFRRDQKDGISPPDLSKECTFAEHIVHARGKRTPFTSVSLDLARMKDFGEASYKLIREKLEEDNHRLTEHEALLEELRTVAQDGEKADRLRAVQALRYAKKRKEGLIQWVFDISKVARKDVITWAQGKIQVYFCKIK
jgi:hypothetical protein